MVRISALLALGLGVLTVAATSGARPAHAQPAPTDQQEADLVYSVDRDQYLLVWVEDRGAGNRIMARRVRGNGLPIGGSNGGAWELTGATGTGAMAGQKGDQRSPALVDDLVVWSEQAPGAADYDIYAQRLFATGYAYGAPTLIAGGPGNQTHPDVVANSRSGEYLVVWSEDTNDAGDVLGMRIGRSLTPRSSVIEVAKGAGVSEDPTIGRDLATSDAFLILFTDDRNGNKDIFGTRVTESGLPRGGTAAAFPVVTSPEDDYAPQLVVDSGTHDQRAALKTSGTRNVLLWTHDDVTDGPDVMGWRLNDNGLPQGSDFVLAGGMGAQSWPAGTLRTSGNPDQWLVVWQDDGTGTFDVKGTELGLNGVSRRTPWLLASD